MRLVQRVMSSVKRRSGVVVFRTELAPLGGTTQIGVALRELIADGVLIRIGDGIYAKAIRDEHGGLVPAAAPSVVLDEVLRKLKVDPAAVCTQQEGSRKTVIVDAPNRKIDRRLELGGCQVEIVSRAAMPQSFVLPQNPADLPRHNVGRYIEMLARRHRISPKRTGLDRWTEAVSRAAGDSVQLDAVGQLLAQLRQRHAISGQQMAHLMNNYMMERDEAAPRV